MSERDSQSPATTEDGRSVLLDIAAELRNNRGAWIRGYFGRTADGMPVDSWDRRATCWCLNGLINKRIRRMPDLSKAVRELLYPFVDGDIVGWNDRKARNVDDVIALCEKAAL